MELRGRRIHIAGSAAPSADERKVRYAHSIVAALASELVGGGAAFVIPFGKEPLLNDRTDGPSIIFDWAVAEIVEKALQTGSATATTAAGRIIATISTSRTDEHIPPSRRELYDRVRERDAVDLKFLRAGWTAGSLRREALARLGDVLIAVSGGQGVEQLAVAYSSRGKPVIPLDLQLGSSSQDGSGGGARLYDRALEDPASFFRVTAGRSAAGLLERTKTKGGETSSEIVVRAILDLLHALTPPRVFYVRLLNSKIAEHGFVETFFRTTVDAAVEHLGFERYEMGIDANEFAWMNEATFQLLHHSAVVVVDITAVRPNCLIELGYALGNQQRVILTAREGTAFPFDVFALDAFIWRDGEDKTTQLERFLEHWQRQVSMPRLVRANEAR
jgi:hypothetical protein